MRSVIYDLRCMTQNGDEFIVEMQQKHFSNRILYYLSYASRSCRMNMKKVENFADPVR